MGEIINKVEQSGLIQLDMASFKPNIDRIGIDLAPQLWQGLVLKEQDFRAWIKSHDWPAYQGKAVFVYCSADAILPTWAFVLVGSSLKGIAETVVIGSDTDLEKELIRMEIDRFDVSPLVDGKIIIKGCSDIPFPAYAMNRLVQRLQPGARSIMYGEPCSTVPIYKAPKNTK
jgi:hypothetical protein